MASFLPGEAASPQQPAAGERTTRFSLSGRITGVFFLNLFATAVLFVAGSALLPLEPWVIALLALALDLPLAAWMLGRVLRPLSVMLQGLSDGIRSFWDRDFSVRLASHRKDELGELARLYNRVGETLQRERSEVRQRELLIQTALNHSPAAILLVNERDRVVYSNREARRLLLGGASLQGRAFSEIRAGCPPEMQQVLSGETDGIFTLPDEEQPETFHLAQRTFQLNRHRHRLLLLRRLTGELGRQEAEIWKKVIRVISHELNNSLAPISSLAHSAQVAAASPRHADRAGEIFDSIRERIDHLKRFIEGYARFARLPSPRKEAVDWSEFLGALGELPFLRLVGQVPTDPGWFDPSQMHQVVINLIKNAEEASNGEPEVTLRIETSPAGESWIQVVDRGRGMDEETMHKSLLPFYSTKRAGTGLGLPLCREILEAHGGKLSLQSQPGEGTIVTCWLPGR
jgi:nitrogen fixation/metabolism regulation signal transduction histidine kinase